MTKSVGSCWFSYCGFLNGEFHSFLQDALMNVMSALFACQSIGEMSARRKYPLPAPLLPCVWIFSLERVRQCDAAQTAIKIALVLSLTKSRCLARGSFTASGSIVCLSLSPLPARTMI